jgi:hypothetical protein
MQSKAPRVDTKLSVWRVCDNGWELVSAYRCLTFCYAVSWRYAVKGSNLEVFLNTVMHILIL